MALWVISLALIVWLLFDLLSTSMINQKERAMAFLFRFLGLFLFTIIIVTELRYGILP